MRIRRGSGFTPLMKLPLVFLGLAAASSLVAAPAPQLVRQWETEPVLKVPEGVLFDAERQVLYVSNVDGADPWAKDDAGSVAKVGLDGRVMAAEWITGLHAPKGMARVGNRLFVADLDHLVVIDLDRGAVRERLPVPGAQRLNDVSADDAGVVYLTDSQTGELHQWKDGRFSVRSKAFRFPNGVRAAGGKVYVLDQETLYRLDGDSEPAVVAQGLKGHVDGVEPVEDGFLVTCWEGVIYHVDGGGKVTTLLDTRAEKVNAADPGWDAKQRILYVPTFWRNSVVAYQLK